MESNYKNMDLKINISPTWTERLILQRLSDDTVFVSQEEDISGIIRKLAYYNPIKKQWTGYNPSSLDTFFKLVKENPSVKSKIIRFITPLGKPYDVWKFQRTFTCFKRKFSIQVQKVATATKREFDDLKEMFANG